MIGGRNMEIMFSFNTLMLKDKKQKRTNAAGELD